MTQMQTLTDAWNRAKAAEKQANDERMAIEAEILALEGSVPVTGEYPIIVTRDAWAVREN
jgi:hypothetical protein